MPLSRLPWTALVISLSFFTEAAEAQKIRLPGTSGPNSVVRDDAYVDRTASKLISVQFSMAEVQLNAHKRSKLKYRKLQMKGIPLTSDVGMPSLPFQAVVLPAARGDIRVEADLGRPVALKVGRLFPAQQEPCRCDDPRAKAPVFTDRVSSYRSPEQNYRLESLGDFRGKAVSRVVLLPHRYDPRTGTLLLYPNARFQLSYQPSFEKRAEPAAAYDYLVLSSREFTATMEPWMRWKSQQQGLRMRLISFEELGLANAAAVKDWMHAEYARSAFKYALIVGGQNRIPQLSVETTTNKNTPSDLPYYTMGAADDIVPEVYAGRIVADDSATVARILKKWMSYESGTAGPGFAGAPRATGWNRAIGVASNQGYNPSDAEYVQSIQSNLGTNVGAQSIYFHQDSPTSRPSFFNQEMNAGAMWMTYLGHGSGHSWSSFGQSYELADIAALRNGHAVKPIWIDVACLNGALVPAAAGAHLMGDADPASGEPIGVAGYYGGTVLISWHPPAIFARGLAYNVSSSLQPILGEALQAGQKYLSENYSGLNDIASNQRWYHLQGDPSMRLRLR